MAGQPGRVVKCAVWIGRRSAPRWAPIGPRRSPGSASCPWLPASEACAAVRPRYVPPRARPPLSAAALPARGGHRWVSTSSRSPRLPARPRSALPPPPCSCLIGCSALCPVPHHLLFVLLPAPTALLCHVACLARSIALSSAPCPVLLARSIALCSSACPVFAHPLLCAVPLPLPGQLLSDLLLCLFSYFAAFPVLPSQSVALLSALCFLSHLLLCSLLPALHSLLDWLLCPLPCLPPVTSPICPICCPTHRCCPCHLWHPIGQLGHAWPTYSVPASRHLLPRSAHGLSVPRAGYL